MTPTVSMSSYSRWRPHAMIYLALVAYGLVTSENKQSGQTILPFGDDDAWRWITMAFIRTPPSARLFAT